MKRGQFCRKFLSSAASNLVSFFFTFLFRVLLHKGKKKGTRRKILRAKKKPCLDDRRDKNPKPLDKDRDTICRVLKSNPQGPAVSRRTNKLLVF